MSDDVKGAVDAAMAQVLGDSPSVNAQSAEGAQSVANRTELLDAVAAAYARGQSDAKATAAAPSPMAPTPTGPPISDGGAPNTTGVAYHRADNPLTWSRDHIAAIYRDKGKIEGRKHIRSAFEAYMENVTIAVPRGR